MTSTPTTAAQVSNRYTVARIARGVTNRIRMYSEGIGSIVPKLIYGSSAGFQNNFGAYRELANLRRQAQIAQSQLREAPYSTHALHLERDGYILFRAANDRSHLLDLKARYLRLIDDPKHSVVSPNGATRFILNPVGMLPELCGLLREDFCRTVASYYRCALRVQSVRAWRNYHVPVVDPDREDVFSNTFHHDALPATGLRVFVLLSDGVTRETGAFRFLNKADSARFLRSLKYFHRNAMSASARSFLAHPTKLKYFEGNLGDTCICNTQQCLHAASVPGPGSFRDILQFEIYPAAGPYRSGQALLENVPRDEEIFKMLPR